ncbi:4-carboxymuconolactone decarboxylase [Sphingobium lignivorans]|uniref:4-carboxymuconolactone decarboxylase n=1 Tax=Sphingobium lignivorans TaxID=2735886 RepID=A0ABR6NF37_9SPHN|nr:4-carboxymuconolactone decarboxylase [Sphingobium lignivorans]MBB5985888.1 4-carboxymuconolactone decarboxylase [Sphingobium lignivorans]
MDKDMFDKGLDIRRSVLGDAYVDRALANMNAFNKPLQELVTQYCWGEVWGREGLSRRDRSLLNLGMIAILNRSHELKAHVRGALNNGLSREEIREVLLQVAIYGGVPAAVDSFRIAGEAFAEIDAEKPGKSGAKGKGSKAAKPKAKGGKG